MQPAMRIVLPIIGLLVAAILGSPASRAFDLAFGAAVGFLIADIGILRTRLDEIGKEVQRLAKEFQRSHQAPAAPAAPREIPPKTDPTTLPEHVKPVDIAPQ